MKLRALAWALLLVVSPAFAADIDGNWTGSIDSPNGPVQVSFTLLAEAEKLTGSSLGPDGNAVPIKDGKIAGNSVSFTLTVDFGMGPTTFNYTGELSGGQLKLNTAFMDMPIEMVLKKS